MALSAAEKQRRYRQRRDADPERRKHYLEKEKAKYRCDLAVGKRKSVAQMSDREKRIMRRKWREQKKRLKEGEKKLKNIVTPPPSPHPTEPDSSRLTRSSASSVIINENTAMTKRDIKLKRAKKAKVAKCYRDLARKNFTIKVLKKKIDSLRKKLKRENIETPTVMTDQECTPRKKTKNIMRKSKKTISRALLFHHTMLAQMRRDKKEGQRYMLKLLSGQLLRKYKLKIKAFKTIGFNLRHKARNIKGSLSNRLRSHVSSFLQRDDVSRLTSSKKSTITRYGKKKQKRLLCDTMKNIHAKYIAEHKDFEISYSVFCRLRPFWIVAPTEKDRQTCLCKVCENSRYLADCLKNNNVLDTNNLSELCKRVVCSTLNKDCMYGECKQCCNKTLVSKPIKDKKQLSWKQWISVKENRTFKTGEEKEITLVKKEVKNGTVMTAVTDLEQLLKPRLTKHFSNIQNQFKYYKQLKEELTDDECLIHLDFAENYIGKLHEEIQSVHFGASQPQITLHTGVYFTKDASCGSTFCTLSDSLQHGPTAVWTYIRPVLDDIKIKHPNVRYIHFFSDGPVTQYKQKKNFYLLSSEIFKMGFKGACWNFHESGHGKGIPDAVGGSLKRTADTRVRCGEDVTSATKFKEVLEKTGTAVTLFVTDPKEVKESEDQYEEVLKKLNAIPNTMQIHQIKTTSPSTVLFRDVSCKCGFMEEPVCKGHEFKERTFNVGTKLSVKCKKKPGTKCQKREETQTSSNQNEEVEDKENVIDLSSREYTQNDYTQILENLSKCKDYKSFKEQCKAIKMEVVQGQCRSIVECRSTVDQAAMDLCPDDIPSTKAMFPTVVRADGDCLPGCGSVFVYGNDSHAVEMRLRIVLELV